MKKVEAIIRPERVNAVKDALADAGFVGLNTVSVTGRGAQKGIVHQGRGGGSLTIDMLPKTKMELVVRDGDAANVCDIIMNAAHTGEITVNERGLPRRRVDQFDLRTINDGAAS